MLLYQSTIKTPLGPMIAIADEANLCLLEFSDRVKLDRQLQGFSVQSQQKVKPLLSIEKELDLYFSRELTDFKTPLRFVGTLFQQRVWQALQDIPFGQTYSYLQIASEIGKMTAYRAVANANGANRLAIIIPCHRVINANGQLGGYAGGLDRKVYLLNHEKQRSVS